MTDSPTPGGRRNGAFGHRDFRLFWLGNLLESLAMTMMAVAIGWQVYELTGDPLDLGLIGLAEFLPLLTRRPAPGGGAHLTPS